MIILEDERDITEEIECKNCEETKVGRWVLVHGHVRGSERGYAPLCFDCFGPRIKWVHRSGGVERWSPVKEVLQ